MTNTIIAERAYELAKTGSDTPPLLHIWNLAVLLKDKPRKQINRLITRLVKESCHYRVDQLDFYLLIANLHRNERGIIDKSETRALTSKFKTAVSLEQGNKNNLFAFFIRDAATNPQISLNTLLLDLKYYYNMPIEVTEVVIETYTTILFSEVETKPKKGFS